MMVSPRELSTINTTHTYLQFLFRGFMKPKSNLVKFAVRLRGKNVEVRVATSVKNVGEGDEQENGLRGIK
jgi:hypothetical protein